MIFSTHKSLPGNKLKKSSSTYKVKQFVIISTSDYIKENCLGHNQGLDRHR